MCVYEETLNERMAIGWKGNVQVHFQSSLTIIVGLVSSVIRLVVHFVCMVGFGSVGSHDGTISLVS